MPLVLLERVPLPSLRTYTSVSIGLLSLSVYYASQLSSAPQWNVNATEKDPIVVPYIEDEQEVLVNKTFSWQEAINNTAQTMVQDPLCIWTLVNMAYCSLILLGTGIQRLVFGDLRVSEQQHVKDKFWNYIFYKFIFVFGIINVQFLDEVVLWCAWFSVLGFLQLLAQLGKHRFEYLSFSPTTPGWSHARLLALLATIFVLSGLMFLVCVGVGFFLGFNVFAFMAAECMQLNMQTLHVMLRYALHLYDLRQGDDPAAAAGVIWEKRGPVAYYTELVFELCVLVLDLLHHIHMLLWSNIFLSMASLVICMQLRHLFHEIQRRVRKHRNYLWVLHHMEQNYPMATEEDLAANTDNCAICWEKMDTARKLPCSHLFHNTCLLSWLEQDTSCPKCRSVLSMQPPAAMESAARMENMDVGLDAAPVPRRHANHFFHFDGSRYVSWLPSFSVEVTHAPAPQLAQLATSQLDAMARQVTAMFPHLPTAAVMADLRATRSLELTIENVLDGRLVPPAFHHDDSVVPTSPPRLIHDWDATPVDGEETQTTEAEFSQSAAHRERILVKRKEQMLLAARRRFLDRQREVTALDATTALPSSNKSE